MIVTVINSMSFTIYARQFPTARSSNAITKREHQFQRQWVRILLYKAKYLFLTLLGFISEPYLRSDPRLTVFTIVTLFADFL